MGRLTVLFGDGHGAFGTQATLHAASPWGVAIGDVNGDGKSDLVTAEGPFNRVSVWRGNGDGTFVSGGTFNTGLDARAVAIGDLNGDGRADVAVTAIGANVVSVLLGNGDGTFAPEGELRGGQISHLPRDRGPERRSPPGCGRDQLRRQHGVGAPERPAA